MTVMEKAMKGTINSLFFVGSKEVFLNNFSKVDFFFVKMFLNVFLNTNTLNTIFFVTFRPA